MVSYVSVIEVISIDPKTGLRTSLPQFPGKRREKDQAYSPRIYGRPGRPLVQISIKCKLGLGASQLGLRACQLGLGASQLGLGACHLGLRACQTGLRASSRGYSLVEWVDWAKSRPGGLPARSEGLPARSEGLLTWS